MRNICSGGVHLGTVIAAVRFRLPRPARNERGEISPTQSSRFEPLNRSAPVPGRCDVTAPKVVVHPDAAAGADIAAPEDGRTPPAVHGENSPKAFSRFEPLNRRPNVLPCVPPADSIFSHWTCRRDARQHAEVHGRAGVRSRNHFKTRWIRRRQFSGFFFSAHSQIRTTRQPDFRRARFTSASRFLLADNF